MKKQSYQIEFILGECPPKKLWESISTDLGLSRWFADKVNSIDDSQMSFVWDKHEQIADIRHIKQSEYIRLHWQDEPEKYYFELRISRSDLTQQVTLTVTDFAYEDDIEDEKQVWKHSISQLRRILGIV